jgi:threonine-phosphate decarboxylase
LQQKTQGFKQAFAGVERHGGDVWGASRELGMPLSRILDLSASLNPLGPPPGLRQEIARAFEHLGHYPDRKTTELNQALADLTDLEPANILTGNGSTALISMLARALKPGYTVLVAPAFGEFTRALGLNRWQFEYHKLSEHNGFLPNGQDLENIWSSDPGCVIVTNPLSPAGSLIDPGWLEAHLTEAKKRGAWLVLDEAFMDFAPAEARAWSAGKIREYNKLIVLRSMTKFYCMAGIRLGYLMAHEEVTKDLEAWGEPWSVNSLAQFAGVYCLGQKDYALKTRKTVDELRGIMTRRLSSLGLQVFPSAVNYLLMRLPEGGPNAAQVAEACRPHGVLMRDCANFMGCGPRHLRIAVCSLKNQERLWPVLEPALNNGRV